MDTALVPQFFNKPTAAVHIRNGYTATEYKLVNVCLNEGGASDFSREYYSVDIWETLSFLGCEKTKNSDWLRNDLFESLRVKPIKWNIFNQDRRLGNWTSSFLAGYGEIVDSRISFQFDPMVVKYFRRRALYSKLLLQIQAPIKSVPVLSIYEYLNDELQRNKTDEIKIPLPLSDLRLMLNIEGNQYPIFKYFNDQVIKPTFSEVTKLTDIEAAYVRKGRPTTGLIITARRKRNFQLALNLGSPASGPLIESEVTHEGDEIVRLLRAYGVLKSKARSLAKRVSRGAIVANLKYCLEPGKEVRNFAPYLVKAIEDNYASWSSAEKDEDRLKSAWQTYRSKQAETRFEALSGEHKEQLRQEFEASIKTDPDAKLIKRKFDYEDGWDSFLVKQEFKNKVLMTLLETPEETDFAAFAAWWPQEEIEILLAKAESRAGDFENAA